MRKRLGQVGLLLAALLASIAAGCATRNARPNVPDLDRDLPAARAFADYPLYWLGEVFEGHELVHLELPSSSSIHTVLIYGTCTPEGPFGDHPTCSSPVELQVQPLCAFIGGVAANRSWQRRSIRGAPVGTSDNAPVLFTNRVQVKVYSGDNVRRGVAYRALQALRSLNEVDPVLGPDDPIPGADREFLAARAPCPL